MIRVKATREGLNGQKTASGYRIDAVVPFVALPSTRALGKFVRLRNPHNGKSVMAIVLDVGPWNEQDHAYVFQPTTLHTMPDSLSLPQRPAAESGIDTRNRVTNKAGIDLGERVWRDLGMVDNSEVEWEFVV